MIRCQSRSFSIERLRISMYVYKNCVPVKEILILLVCLFRARSFHLGEGVDRDCNVKLVQKQAVIVAKMLHDQRSFFLQYGVFVWLTSFLRFPFRTVGEHSNTREHFPRCRGSTSLLRVQELNSFRFIPVHPLILSSSSSSSGTENQRRWGLKSHGESS